MDDRRRKTRTTGQVTEPGGEATKGVSGKDKEGARVAEVLRRLAEHYRNPRTELSHRSPFELLVATILSAQATDRSVNEVTPVLFDRYPHPGSLGAAKPEELYPIINRIGLFRNKARSLVGAARMICEQFGGDVPRDREALLRLPGVGRKTANVVLSNAFGVPAIAVDTHVFRVSRRLGLADEKTPERVEAQLQSVIPRESWSDAHHWLILHGRQVCSARRPSCQECFLVDVCLAGKAGG